MPAPAAGQGTHDQGLAGPDPGDSAPCSPLAEFCMRVCCFSTAWWTQTLDRLLGPGNRHTACSRLDGQATSMGARSQDAQPMRTSLGTAMQNPSFYESTVLNGIFIAWNAAVPCASSSAELVGPAPASSARPILRGGAPVDRQAVVGRPDDPGKPPPAHMVSRLRCWARRHPAVNRAWRGRMPAR